MTKKVGKTFADSVARVNSTRAAYVRAVRAHSRWLAKQGVDPVSYVAKTLGVPLIPQKGKKK